MNELQNKRLLLLFFCNRLDVHNLIKYRHGSGLYNVRLTMVLSFYAVYTSATIRFGLFPDGGSRNHG